MKKEGAVLGERTLVKIALTLAVVSLLSYFLVASSPEYQHYAPVTITNTWLYLGYVIFGAFLVVYVRSWWAVLAAAVVPSAVFGVALVVLPNQLGLVALLGVLHPFVTWSLQRVVIHLLFSFSLTGVGAFSGYWLREMLPSSILDI